MGRSTSGSEAESRKSKKNAMEHDDRQAYMHKDVPLQSDDQDVIKTISKPKNRKPVDQLGSNGKFQKYSYAKEQESHEKRLYARNGKEAYQAYGYQRHAKEEYQGYSSNVRTGRRGSPPPPKLQMMKYDQNPMLKKKAIAYKDNDSGSTSSEEDEDEYRGKERVGRRSSPPPKLQMMKNQTNLMSQKKVGNRTSSKEDRDESSSDDDDKASYDVFKRMSRMELNSSKFMKTKMMKW